MTMEKIKILRTIPVIILAFAVLSSCKSPQKPEAKGQVLAELDAEAITLQLKQAEAALAVAQASFNNTQTNLERMERLSKEKAVSDQQYEQVKLGYDSAKAQLEQARAAVNLAQHSLDVSILKR